MIVDLAVEHDVDSAVGRMHWLMSASEVNDAEALHPERDARRMELAAIVRATMRDGRAHRIEPALGHCAAEPPAPPTHHPTRKSVVQGKSESVRVGIGCSRTLK